ncbi:hypothetical protein D3C72_1309350 [compost metagenome]
MHGRKGRFDIDVQQPLYAVPVLSPLIRTGIDIDACIDDDKIGHFGIAHSNQPGNERVMIANIQHLRDRTCSVCATCVAQGTKAGGITALQNQDLCSCPCVLQRKRPADCTRCAGNQYTTR